MDCPVPWDGPIVNCTSTGVRKSCRRGLAKIVNLRFVDLCIPEHGRPRYLDSSPIK